VNGTGEGKLRRFDVGDALSLVAAVMVIVGLFMALVYAPDAINLPAGPVRLTQHVFYFHVASAWVGFFAFFVTLVGSVMYLWKGERRWDILALSSVEIGVAFIAMVLVTGPLWARPTWGIWWTWEPKLTTAAILELIYVAYLMLRAMTEDPERRARFAAVLGIVGFIDVPIVFGAVRWWGATSTSAHPIVVRGGGFDIGPKMLTALLFCIAAFTVLYFALLVWRMRLERLRDGIRQLKQTWRGR